MNESQKSDLRHEVRAALVHRHPAALSPRQIAKVVKKELDFLFEETDVIAALEFLRGHTPPQVDFTFDELGGGKFWRATTTGVLQEERA